MIVYNDFYRGRMNENASADYKTVRGLSRGLLLLNLLNKFDGGATVGTLAEFSGLHRTTVRRLLETLQDGVTCAAAAPMTAFA